MKKPLTQEGSPCCPEGSGQHGRASRSRLVTGAAYSARRRTPRRIRVHPSGRARTSLVAEGVKEDATAAVLRDLGCDVAQGFGIARPMPVAAFLDWLVTERARLVAR